MKRAFVLCALLACVVPVRGDGRPGTVTFSDGHTLTGGLLLSPGKELRIYTSDTVAVTLSLDQVKEIRVKVEKEEMRKGYYFPNPGQATQAETGDVYPVRYLTAEITLEDGKTIAGHLLTTMLYCENDDGTQKVPLMAKITGEDKQKIDDLVYAQDIRFDSSVAATGGTQIDLTQAGFLPKSKPVILAKPTLAPLPATQIEGKQAWIVASDHPESVLFSVEAADGVHVAWPSGAAGSDVQKAVQNALVDMHDFYDSRTLLDCAIEGDEDVYALVMLKRVGSMIDAGGHPVTNGMIPWDVVVMHFNYDAEAKKVTLLNRTTLVVGRANNNSPLPAVLKQPELLRDISARTNP